MAKFRYYNAVILMLAAIMLPSFFYVHIAKAQSDYNVSITAIVGSVEEEEPPAPAPPSGGGGGGGGGAFLPPVQATTIEFRGRAYPSSNVVLLRDARVVASTTAGSDSFFLINLTDISAGNYIFSLYAKDADGVRSKLSTFPISVIKGATTMVSGIFITPTLSVDKKSVEIGEILNFSGQTFPGSEVTISVNVSTPIFKKTVADKSGVYRVNFDTSVLSAGKYSAKSKSAIDSSMSDYGEAVSFQVGEAEPEPTTMRGDVNGDGRVNLIDFSIAAFWYKKPNPPEKVDVKRDGIVDLIDFSVMTFYWTG